MSRKRILIIVFTFIVLCVAGVAAVALASSGSGTPAAQTDSLKPGPVPVTSPLPPEGLVVEGGTFKPLDATKSQAATGKTLMTEQQVIDATRDMNTRDLPTTAVLSSLTLPGGYLADPSGSSKTPREIKDIPVWVLTFSLPAPIDMSFGGRAGTTPPPIVVSHHTIVLDAYTGEFIWGFFTR